MSTVTIQLLQVNEIEVDLDIITEYGCFSVAKEIPTCYPYRDIFPKYVAMGKTCYVKLYPSSLEMYITPESLKRVYAAKKKHSK